MFQRTNLFFFFFFFFFFLRKQLHAMYIINSVKMLFQIEEVFFDFQNLDLG